MAESVITDLRGEEMRAEMERRHNVAPMSLDEQMKFYDAEQLFMDRKALDDAYLQLAIKIYDQELELMEEQGDDYMLPAFIALTNGAIPVIAEVGKHLSDYKFDFDPFLIRTKTYGKGEHARAPKVRQGLDDEDLVALNGRRVIVIDDMWDTGTTAMFIREYVVGKMAQGSVEIEDEDNPSEIKTVELIPLDPSSVQFAFLVSKQPEVTAAHAPPTLWIHDVPDTQWTTGAGGNSFKKFRKTLIEQSIGRFARIVTMRRRPKSSDPDAH